MTTTIAPPQPRIFRRYTGDSRCHNPGVTTAERYVTLYRSGRQWSATPDAPGSAHIVCAGYPYGSNRWALRAIEGLDGGMAPIVAEAWAYRSGGRLALLETLRVALEARLRRSVTHRGFENTMRGVGPTRAMGSASHEWDRIRLTLYPSPDGWVVEPEGARARPVLFRCIGAADWKSRAWRVDLAQAVSEPLTLTIRERPKLAEALRRALSRQLGGADMVGLTQDRIDSQPRALDMELYGYPDERADAHRGEIAAPGATRGQANGRSRLPAERGSSPGNRYVPGCDAAPPGCTGSALGDGGNKVGPSYERRVGRRTANSGEQSAGQSPS